MLVWTWILLVQAFDEDLTWRLNYENFEAALQYQPKILVFFTSKNCEKCKIQDLEFIEAAESLNENLIRIGKVDCEEEKKLCEKLEVGVLPETKYFVEGKAFKYHGPVLKNGIVKWLIAKWESSVKEIGNVGEVEKRIGENRVNLVYFGNPSDSDMKALQTASIKYEKIKFFVTQLTEDYEKFAAAPGTIMLFKGNKQIEFSQSLESPDFSKFLSENKPAKVYEFNEDSIKIIFEQKNNTFFFLREESHKNTYQSTLEKLADTYQSQLLFVAADISLKGNFAKLANALGISPSVQPICIIIDLQSTFTKYRSHLLSFAELSEFINNFLAGNLLPYYKSQPISEETITNDVKKIVGSSHESLISDSTSDVMILYYTENHEECNNFLKIYEKIAFVYKQYPDFTAAKMDIVYNEAENLQIPKIPLLKLYPKGNKAGIQYTGDLNMVSVLAFLSQNLKVANLDL